MDRPDNTVNSVSQINRSALFQQRFKKFTGDCLNNRMIGFMLCRAWVYVSFSNALVMYFAQDQESSLHLVYLASLVALVFTHLVVGVINTGMEKFYLSSFGKVFPATLTALGSLMIIAGNNATAFGTAICIVSGVFTGVGSGLILVCWGRIYSSTGGPTAASECSLAFLIATLFVPLYVILPPLAELLICSALPVVSAVLLASEFTKEHHEAYLSEKTNSKFDTKQERNAHKTGIFNQGTRLLIKLSVSSLVFGSSVGIIRMLHTVNSEEVSPIFTSLIHPVSAVIASTIVIGILLLARRLDMAFTYRPVIIFSTISMLILPLLNDSYFLTYVLALSGYFCFEILNWVMLADISFRYDMSAYRVFSFGRAAVSGGILVGDLVGFFLLRYPGETTIDMLYVVSLAIIFLMVITYTLTLTERDVAHITRVEPRTNKIANREYIKDEILNNNDNDLERENNSLTTDERVEILALQHGINGRAYDVLLLMAKGRTAARIEQELYISRGTVNTYSHKIYQKLGIHSRQELFDLLDNIEE